jgi:glutamate carboxypeptidase
MENFVSFLDGFIHSRKSDMLGLWRKLVNIDTGPGCERGLNDAADILCDRFARSCSSVERRKFDGAPDSIFAIRRGDGQRKGRIVLLGHMDTVFPEGTAKARPFSAAGDIVRGPGVLDMKGGLVQIAYVLEALEKARWHGLDVAAVISGDEETGHENSQEESRRLFAEAAEDAVALMCCESGLDDGALVTARKGVGEIVVTARGRSAHAGNDFERGANAIVAVAGKVVEIASLSKGVVTLNVGTVKGGLANNIVPDFAEITVDARFLDDAEWSLILERVEEIVSKVEVPGTVSSVRSRLEIPAMKETEKSLELLEYLSEVRKKISGKPLSGSAVGGGADSSFFAALGVPCLCAMGPVGALNHTPDEYAGVSSLFERTKLLAAAIAEFGRCQSMPFEPWADH